MSGNHQPATIIKPEPVQVRLPVSYDDISYYGRVLLAVSLLATGITVLGALMSPFDSAYVHIFIWLTFAAAFFVTGGGNSLVGLIAAHRASRYLFANLPKRRYLDIERELRKANVVVERIPRRERTWYSGIMLSNMALMRLYQGDYDTAEKLLRQAYALTSQDKRMTKHLIAPLVSNNLAVACLLNDKPFEGEELAEKTMQLWQLQNKNNRTGACMSHLILSSICLTMNELDRAQEEIHKFQAIINAGQYPKSFSKDSFLQAQANAHLMLAIIYAKQKHYGLAKDSTDKFLTMAAESPHCVSTMTLRHLNGLCEELLDAGDHARSEKLLEIAYALGREFHHHPEAVLALERYERLLIATNREADVADMKRWIRPLAYELAIASAD